MYPFTKRTRGEAALDSNGTVAMCLHQALKKPVEKHKTIFFAVRRFSGAKQLHRATKGGNSLVNGVVEDHRRIDRGRNRIILNPIVEDGVRLA
jgi:hypothetical protein